MAAPNPPQRLEARAEDALRDWIKSIPALNPYLVRERDEDVLLFPEGEIPRPVLIVVAKDQGRTIKGAPIRNLHLTIIVRANAKCPGGDAQSFAALGGILENALDTTNLVAALSTETIGFMLVTRQPGIGFRAGKLVREGRIELECKCVAAELTVGGTGIVSYG